MTNVGRDRSLRSGEFGSFIVRRSWRNLGVLLFACGIATGTRMNHGGQHGSHHIITLRVMLPEDGPVNIQIAVNDNLSGAVSARPGDSVFAYGQGYIAHGAWSAGIHDVHCATHRSADNGWVVVNGIKSPSSCAGRFR